MASVQTTMQAEVIYRTEYILKVKQFMRRDDLDKIRAEFLEGLKSGVAFQTPNVEVETHQQPIAVLLSDGTIVKLEGSND